MHPRNLFVAVLLGVALSAGIWIALSIDSEPERPLTATVLPSKTDVPAFQLVDDQGADIDESVFRGQWDLVFFGFTHCPDICPITLQVLASARSQLADEGQSPLPRIVLVSVDPERDTPESLARYVGSFGGDTLGITGDIEQIRRLTDGLGVFFEKRDAQGDSDYYVVDHSSVVLVIDPDGRFHALFSSPHDIENFVHDLPILLSS